MVNIVLFLIVCLWRIVFSIVFNPFGQDGARDLYLAKTWRESGNWIAAYGPKASVGNFYLPPLYYQLTILGSALTRDWQYTMKFFVVILESFTPVLVALIALHLGVSKRFSILLGFFYGISVLPTIFGSFAWNPNTIPFFTTLGIFAWLKYVHTRRKTWLILYPLTVAIAISLHYQAVVLLPFAVSAAAYVAVKRRADLSWLVLGIGLSALIFVPYVWKETANQWQNTRAIVRYFTQEHAVIYERVSKPDYVVRFYPRFIEQVTTGTEQYRHLYGYAVYVIGSASLALAALRRKNNTALWLSWFLLSLFIMLRVYKGDKLEYYMSTLFILPGLLLAAASLYRRRLAAALVLIGIFLAGTQLAKTQPEQGFVQLQKVMAFIQDSAQGRPVRLFFHNDDYLNTVVYGLTLYPKILVDQNSRLLVEICDTSIPCQWDGIPQCSVNRQKTFMALVKSSRGYTPLQQRYFSPRYQIAIGELGESVERIDYAPYAIDFSHGTDFLKPEWFEQVETTVP